MKAFIMVPHYLEYLKGFLALVLPTVSVLP